MIIESGVIVAIGLIFTFFKLKWKTRLKMLGKPLLMDVTVFTLLTMLHWGTFSGVMVATTGALICSALISLGRKTFGYIEKGEYFPGMSNVRSKIV